MNISQAAKLLGVSRTVVYRLIDEKRLTPQRNPIYKGKGGPVRIPLAEIEALKPRP